MTQDTLKKINKNIAKLQEEMELLRSSVIGAAGEDKEGSYRPEFVERVLKAASEDAPFSFENRVSFLRHLHDA